MPTGDTGADDCSCRRRCLDISILRISSNTTTYSSILLRQAFYVAIFCDVRTRYRGKMDLHIGWASRQPRRCVV